MSTSPVPPFVTHALDKLGIDVPGEMLERLAAYLDLLLSVNREFNLTGIRDPDEAWHRHIIDSLTLLPFLAGVEQNMKLIDVGTGGGLPGIPLAITRPDVKITLLEATGKKVRFLERCVSELPLENVSVLHGRAETFGQDPRYRENFDAAVCRAVGPMAELMEYALPLVRVDGVLLAMKGPKARAELDAAANAMDVLGVGELQVYDAYDPDSDQQLVIVMMHKQRPTPKSYPRVPGMPRQQPL